VFPLSQSAHTLALSLAASGGMLLVLMAADLAARAVRRIGRRRRARIMQQCRPLVDELLLPHASLRVTEQLARYVPKHRDVVEELMIAAARVLSGPVIERLRHTARVFGTLERWKARLASRRWRMRAAAARALGHLRDGSAVDALIKALDDREEDVRAAAVEALGNIGDPRAVPALVSALPHQSLHQRLRLVDALQRFGRAAVPSLRAHEQLHPEDRATVAGLLGRAAASESTDDLLRWMDDPRPAVRVACMRALGSIGFDSRGRYFALRALSTDSDAGVRAMAARALGSAGHTEAIPYIAARLKDERIVAAHAALALQQLGAAGAAELRRFMDGNHVPGNWRQGSDMRANAPASSEWVAA
jgi:HEAT repeat protein